MYAYISKTSRTPNGLRQTHRPPANSVIILRKINICRSYGDNWTTCSIRAYSKSCLPKYCRRDGQHSYSRPFHRREAWIPNLYLLYTRQPRAANGGGAVPRGVTTMSRARAGRGAIVVPGRGRSAHSSLTI